MNRSIRGRGTAENPANRFEHIEIAPLPSADRASPPTEYHRDHSRTILSKNDSPDVPFTYSVNPYRGCEHGCVYCYARAFHEYLGLSAGLDFESKILVKENAPLLLRRALSTKTWKPQVIALSGATDAYQPVESELKLTRQCIRVFAEFLNPISIITKSALVVRDIDVMRPLQENRAVRVDVSVTTLDPALAHRLEPRAAGPSQRLRTIESLAKADIPTGVMVGPVIPGLTDHELPSILKSAADAGAVSAAYIVLRLPHGVEDLFVRWLDRHYPDRKNKILNRLKQLRPNKHNNPRRRSRMKGSGLFSKEIKALFDLGKKKAGLTARDFELNTDAFVRPELQMDLFSK